jgi:hypothetical protein
MTERFIKEWNVKAPSWGQIVDHYRARPGRVEWLAKRLPVMRGEVNDTPEPDVLIVKEQEAAE